MKGRIEDLALFLIFTVVISGCTSVPESHKEVEAPMPEQVSLRTESTAPAMASGTVQSGPARVPHQQILEMGTGEYITEPTAPVTREPSAGTITLNFQDSDLREFIKVILSDVLGENYLVDPGVGGSVTMDTPTPLSREDILPLLEEVLAINGAAVVRSAGMYRILPLDQAGIGNIAPTTISTVDSNGYSIRIIPLEFIAAQEMQKILEPYVAERSRLRIDTKRNLVIVNGTSQELNLIQETIDIFDMEWMRGMSMGLYPLTYVDAKSLKTELDTIIHAMDTEPGEELLGGLVRTVSIDRLNSILLISSTTTALREVEIWVHRLDKPGEHVGKRLYVYNVQNAKAVDLADILGQVFDRGRQSTAQAPRLAPGLAPVDIGNVERTQPSPATSTQDGMFLPENVDIEIIGDDVRNALVVLATPQEYSMVEAAIQKLDVVPLQVLIEASILEVTLRDDLSYGVEWFFKNSLDSGDKQGIGLLDLGSQGIVGLTPGFSYAISGPDAVRVAINALQNESEVNVLSSPSLMVLDNQTATINVGDEIPVPSRQSVSNLDPSSPTVNEIDYRKTGVTLNVTPRVNTGGLVTMEVKQEVSSAVTTTTSDIDAPTIQNRLIESVVAINSGDTVILGGLIQDTATDSDSGIPGIHKIPIIGKIFGRKTKDNLRTELLVLITPRVVGNRGDARNITEEFRKKLRGIIPLQIKQSVDKS